MAQPESHRNVTPEPLPSPTGGLPRWVPLLLGFILFAAMVALVAGGEAANAFQTMAWALAPAILLVPAWMAGLLFTAPLARRCLFDDSAWPRGFRSLIAIALGLGSMSLVTVLWGSVGLLFSPWLMLLVPGASVAAGFTATRDFVQSFNRRLLRDKAHRGDWLLILAAVPVAMLLLSATFPPGSLWNSEGNGYDVLEYHLQLPREFAENHSVAPLDHNVYSYLPANVEMLYLLLVQFGKLIMADPSYLWGTFPAQFLHAILMLLSALALALFPGINGGTPLRSTGRAVTVLVFLGVPWTIVTGSLAYNEGGMLFFGILAMGAAMGGEAADRTAGHWGARGILIGALLGLAVGCKMTAGVFFAVPVAAILLVRALGNAAILKSLTVSVGVAILAYAPWAIRAAINSGGNPLFPIASNVLPRDGWTAEQSDIFNRGHGAPAGINTFADRARQLARSSLLDPQWSVSWNSQYLWTHVDPPDRLNPWKRLGWLWILVPMGVVLALVGKENRGITGLWLLVLAIQVAAWMYLTHLQPRFLLPAVVPLAMLLGRAAQGLGIAREGVAIGSLRVLIATGAAVLALATVFLLLPEVGLLGGMHERQGVVRGPPPIGELFGLQINVPYLARVAEHPAATENAGQLMELPPPESVLLVGDSDAWRFAGDVFYSTVFNRSLLSDALHQKDASAALAFLHARGIHYVWINWSEVDRLRKSYGFDPAITPEALAGWTAAGAQEIPLEQLDPKFRGITLLRLR